MLSIAAIHVIITLVCIITGRLFYRIISDNSEKPFLYQALTGLIVLTTVSQVAALFLPVNHIFSAAVIGVVLLIAFIRKRDVLRFRFMPRPVTFVLFAAAAWLVVLFFSAGPVMMDDTESYHIQMVKWIYEYGTVPGIANLHERFGFNSSWFSSVSFFLAGAGEHNFFTSLNGLLSLWFCIHVGGIIVKAGPDRENSILVKTGALVMLVLAFLSWPVLRGNAATTNYDFITALVIVTLFTGILMNRNDNKGLPVEWLLWPVFLLTVRITNFPILLLPLYALVTGTVNRRQLWMYAGLSILLVAPFLARNIMLSGYPVFPSMFVDVFRVDWKVDPAVNRDLLTYIKYYNRVNYMFQDMEVTREIPFPQWTFYWFRYLFTYDKLVLVPGILGIIVSLFRLRHLKTFSSVLPFFVTVLLAQLLTWFVVAPDPRFVYGPLLCGAFLLPMVIPYAGALQKLWRTPIVFMLLSLALLGYAGVKFIKTPPVQNFMLPVKLPQPPLDTLRIDGLRLHIPHRILDNWNPRCYATPLPCLYKVDARLRARGDAISDGFRIQK
ncbi:MAG TPA: hypothetical protein VFZ78_05335 [Flavisolibacter sp.]